METLTASIENDFEPTNITLTRDSVTYTWSIALYKKNGKVSITWLTDAPCTAQKSHIYLLSEEPSNIPPNTPRWKQYISDESGTADTPVAWSDSGKWWGAIVAQVGPYDENLGNMRYVVKVGPVLTS